MNIKHLFWIIPIALILGLVGGYLFGVYSSELLGGMLDKMDTCSIDTLSYAMEQNNDCRILITGKMQECYANQSESKQ